MTLKADEEEEKKEEGTNTNEAGTNTEESKAADPASTINTNSDLTPGEEEERKEIQQFEKTV